MGTFIFLLIIAALVGGVFWNHRSAASAREGVSFVVPHPPAAVAAAIDRGHNKGAVAAIRSGFGGVSVTSLGPTSFGTSTKIGDSGEISVRQDPTGSLVSVRALDLYIGSHPMTHNMRFSAVTHGLARTLGIAPSAAKIKRWQRGLEGRVSKSLAKAST